MFNATCKDVPTNAGDLLPLCRKYFLNFGGTIKGGDSRNEIFFTFWRHFEKTESLAASILIQFL